MKTEQWLKGLHKAKYIYTSASYQLLGMTFSFAGKLCVLVFAILFVQTSLVIGKTV